MDEVIIMNAGETRLEVSFCMVVRNGELFVEKLNTNEMPIQLACDLFKAINTTISEHYKLEKN